MTGAILGWPRLFLKQFIFGSKIKRLCRKNGYLLHKNKLFWWVGKNSSSKYNFTIDCRNIRYCVKIIGVRSKRIYFGFVNKNNYEIRDLTFATVQTMDGFDYILRRKKPYEFEDGAFNCIVMVPESVKVTLRSRNEKKERLEIGSRDTVPEGEFFFGDKFIEFIKQNAHSTDI